MRVSQRWVGMGLVTILLAAPAAAQEVGEKAGQKANAVAASTGPGRWAAGGDLGWAAPLGADSFDDSFFIDAFFEYRQNRAVSWRGLVSHASFDGDRRDVDLLAVNANVIYQWEAPNARPFLTAGIGVYFYDRDDGDDDVELGANFGGGVNLRVAPRLDVKLEAVLHGTSGPEPDSFFLATVGLRYRF